MKTFTGAGMTGPYDSSDLTNYPKGRYLDSSSPGAGDGTPVNRANIDDFYQAFVELLRLASITPDESNERKANSQFIDALQALFMQITNVVKIPVGYGVFDSTLTMKANSGVASSLSGGKLILGVTDTSTKRAIATQLSPEGDYIVQPFLLGEDSDRIIHANHDDTTCIYDDNNADGSIFIQDIGGGAVTNLAFGYLIYKKIGAY